MSLFFSELKLLERVYIETDRYTHIHTSQGQLLILRDSIVETLSKKYFPVCPSLHQPVGVF